MKKSFKNIPPYYAQYLDVMLNEMREEERKALAGLISARLDTLATHIVCNQLSYIECGEFLRDEVINIQRSVQEVH